MSRSLLFSLVVFLILADRILKIAALKGLLSGSFWFFGYPHLTLHKNFGLTFNLPLFLPIIIALSLIFIITLVVFIIINFKNQQTNIYGIILIIAGAMENLIDRIHYGFVIDLIEVFPNSIWNIADFTILLGIIFILLNQKHRRQVGKKVE